MVDLEIILPVIIGLLQGAMWAGFKYALEKYRANPEPFDAMLFLKTLLIGVIVNFIATAFGLPIGSVDVLSLTEVVTIFIDALVNAIIRNRQVIQSNEQLKTG